MISNSTGSHSLGCKHDSLQATLTAR